MLKPSLRYSRGVTLIELIVGIVVLAISLSIITSVLGPLFIKSADPWHQVRAAELGQSLMNEILSRRFDKNSFKDGSLLRCGEVGAASCSAIPVFNPPRNSARSGFIGVEDYNNYATTGDTLTDAKNDTLAEVYRNYSIQVDVVDDAVLANMRRITIIITPPSGSSVRFTAYKGNW
ncbi:MSHA pilin protein MshD [Rheinheimera pacifica]|uniref:type IV pilus modification PilV family protein n=1 Tax=Rheinheimera pacifica TaxID=173990 RepID=UPI002167AD26|nr:prepilin-type N-terminal cleavage/methylation domain-containing protein [Rheinheimera pacifica]MCS4308889.1 MSHA pilin protein MshD [Rheinheimera pacifica]